MTLLGSTPQRILSSMRGVTCVVLAAITLAAEAEVTRYTDINAFRAATGSAHELFTTTAADVLQANEVSVLPGPNTRVGSPPSGGEGRTLTFDRSNTGLFYSFEFTALEPTEFLTYDDDEGAGNLPNFDNALSPGDIDNGQNDDWRVRLIDPRAPLRAFGFELRDNNNTAGEFLRLYDSSGDLVHEIAVGDVSLNGFMGVVSDEPFVEIRFDEDPGGDDIAVTNFRFIRTNPAPTAVDVFAATPVSTGQNPQAVTVTLEGADEASAALTYSIIGTAGNGILRDPGNGDAVVNNSAISGQIVSYTPDPGFIGTDTFVYRVNDGNSDSEIRIATIEVFEAYRQQALQMGGDIAGEAAGDQSGWPVALSSDGQTVAIGAWSNNGNGSTSGHTRIYGWSGSSWMQRGADIDGEAAGDQSGWSVALSSDGLTVAIGASGNDGNGQFSGHARVYVWSGSSWVQRGSDIDGEAAGDRSGYSLALSSDGQTVAIGAVLNDGNGRRSGHVRIYTWTGSSWTQRGADINGEAAGDASGESVALSSDGQTVAIGAVLNDGNGSNAGHVRIYRWTGSSWVQIGADIDGEAAVDQSGWSVALSNDGQTVAIGAPFNGRNAGHVRIYAWNGSSWLQRGADIDAEADFDESGRSVGLSSDGQTVAIGAIGNDGNGSLAGHTRIYAWSGSNWVQIGTDIDGEAAEDRSGWSVALSSDGQTVAIGEPFKGGLTGNLSGRVRIYDLTLSPNEDDDNDGVINGNDQCPDTSPGDTSGVNGAGCALTQLDSDNDGVNDALDAFPNDPSETTDSDGDGLGDNREGQLGTNPNSTDSDGDGFSDLDEVEAESNPLSANDIPPSNGLNIPLIKAAIDRT